MNLSESIYKDAVGLLEALSTENGIQASLLEADNYKRVWARDSIIAGIAGLLVSSPTIIEGFRQTLITLAQNQHERGMIPSNVGTLSDGKYDVSMGSLVGRVDANCWFIIGSILYKNETNDQGTWTILEPAIRKCREFLSCIEFNGKGWLYTPYTGNWADEYPIHGYTLYDNTLRLWAERLWKQLGHPSMDIFSIESKNVTNFYPSETDYPDLYHKVAYRKALENHPKHFCSFILPGHYDQRFDMAGNAMGLLLYSLDKERKENYSQFIQSYFEQNGNVLIPAFYPVIHRNDVEWNQIAYNYSYDFKNEPHHFHNGGIWPIWLGWFSMGLAQQGLHEWNHQLIREFIELIQKSKWSFNEYIDSKAYQLKGKTKMAFSASGIVFMYHSLNPNFSQKLGL